jgi:hypothetical protein
MDNPDNRTTQPRRLHPLIAAAAGAVIVASLAGTAAVTGLFSKASGTGAQTDQTQAAQVTAQQQGQPPVVDSAAPVNGAAQQPQLAQQQPQPAPQQLQRAAPPEPAPAPAPPQQQLAQQQQAQAAPQYAQQPTPQPAYCSTCGTVVAISAVHQEGRTAMTLLGALGGGLAGNSVEKHIRSSTSYSVRVRMENGKMRYFTYHEAPPFQQGQHVRVENSTLVAG